MASLAISPGKIHWIKTHPQASHGITAIAEHVTGVPKVLSFLIQHKGMTFHAVKYFLPSWGAAPTQTWPYRQRRRERGTTPVTLMAKSFTDPLTNPCPWLNIHTANLPKPSKCNSLCPPEAALSLSEGKVKGSPYSLCVCVYIYK